MKAVLLRLPFFVVLAVLALHQSHAQPAYPTIESIDATVLNARTIVVGTVTGVVDKSSAEHVREVTFKVAETLKGESVGHLTINVHNSVQELELWKARSARLLVSAPSRTNARAVSIIDLGDEKLLVSKEDFTFLRSPRDLLEYVRQLVRQNPGVYEILVYVLPPPDTGVGAAWQRAMGERRTPGEPPFWGLHVPVNQRLERTARNLIRSKELLQRQQGVMALRLFKSEQNTAILEALLKDPGFVIERTAETNRGLEHRRYPIREAAFRTLAGYWRLPVEQPVMEESVSRIDRIESMTWVEKLADADLWRLRQAKRLRSLVLSNVPLAAGQLAMVCDLTGLTHLQLPPLSVGDASVKQLGGLKHLRSLTLDQNPITDEGLKELAGFTSLKEVSLKETEVTDEGLASLRRSRPDLKVLPANAISAINLYVQNNDLAGVARVLDRTPKVTEEKSRGVTPLQVAAYDCKYEMTKLLLDRGAAVDGLDSEGNSPLTRAAIYYRPNLEVIGLLLARGADVNRVNKSGTSALDLAVDNQNPGLIRLLLACGADPEAKKKRDNPMGLRREMKPPEFMTAYSALRKKQVSLIEQNHAECGRTVYTLDRMSGHLEHWSSQTVGQFTGALQWSRSPSGRDFLGPFGQQAVTLNLTGLPEHGNVHVELELFIIGSWDGTGGLGAGPDILDVHIPGVGTALHSTFFNNTELDATDVPMQSFPDTYPFGFHKGYTGAASVRSLGFTESWDGRPYKRDAVYDLRYTFAHSGSGLQIVITGHTVPEIIRALEDDERWGIGRIVVKTD